MPLASSGPQLVRLLNINYGGEIVTFIWTWFYEETGVGVGGALCESAEFVADGGDVVGSYVSTFAIDDDNTVFPGEYEVLTGPSTPTGSVGFPALQFESVHMGANGNQTISPVTQQGSGAGSVVVPIWGVGLNGILACYGPVLGEGGVIGILHDPLDQPPFEDTGQRINFSWPNITVRNPDGAVWDVNTYAFNATFKTLTLSVTFNSEDQ